MTKVIYASTHDKDLLYKVKRPIHDAVFFVDFGDRAQVYLDKREIGVFQETTIVGGVEAMPLEPLLAQAQRRSGSSLINHVAEFIFEHNGLFEKSVQISDSMPVSMVDWLREKGAELTPVAELYPERQVKIQSEIAAITAAHQKVHRAFARIEQILADALVAGSQIIYQNAPLTSERVKQEVERVLLEENLLLDAGMIISSGPQAAMPHHEGSGELLANQTIICDLFPRDRSSDYYADMTRTYVKGEPADKVTRMYDATRVAQEAAFEEIKPGVTPESVHEAVVASFEQAGFSSGGEEGFIHGTGHGLGLDVHEAPYLKSGHTDPLQPGAVVTVEPGLYYPEHGGVRIEDVVVVTKDGHQNLTNYPKQFVIP